VVAVNGASVLTRSSSVSGKPDSMSYSRLKVRSSVSRPGMSADLQTGVERQRRPAAAAWNENASSAVFRRMLRIACFAFSELHPLGAMWRFSPSMCCLWLLPRSFRSPREQASITPRYCWIVC
jgi:hypothetical protein